MSHDPMDNPSETIQFEERFKQLKKKWIRQFLYWIIIIGILSGSEYIFIKITEYYNPNIEIITEPEIESLFIFILIISWLFIWLFGDDIDIKYDDSIPNAFDRSQALIEHQLNETHEEDPEEWDESDLEWDESDLKIHPHTPRPAGYFQIPSLDPHDYNIKNGWIYWHWLWSFMYRMKRWVKRTIGAKYVRLIVNWGEELEDWNWYKETDAEVIGVFFVYRNRLYQLDIELFDNDTGFGDTSRIFHLEYGDFYSTGIIMEEQRRSKYLDDLLRLKYDNRLDNFSEDDHKENWEVKFEFECMTLSQLTSFLFYLRMANDPNELIQWVN